MSRGTISVDIGLYLMQYAGMKLADYLVEKKLTLAVFAERVGRSESTISRLARGVTQPDWDTVARIAEATGGAVTANDFVNEQAA